MPKRYKHLFEQVVSLENLFAAAHKAMRGKRGKIPVARCFGDLEKAVVGVRADLVAGTWQPGEYFYFTIHEPKEREVAAAPFRDRIVHHALVRVLEPIFDPRFIADSYACRPGKGTHAGLARAHQFTKRYRYCLKCDIQKYFPHIDHALLRQQIEQAVGDRRLLEVIDRILASHIDGITQEWSNAGNLFSVVERPRGLPIGNLTSQFFANIHLHPLGFKRDRLNILDARMLEWHFLLHRMRTRRTKVSGASAVYHCMTRTVNGERLFEDREKEILRQMLWQVAEFSGVEILTYCIMSNHFHVLVRVSDRQELSDTELMRRYKVLYPRPTKYQEASAVQMARTLEEGGDDADVIRRKLRARMGDVSEFMKALKQRFSVWYNRSHQRYGTLWAERFKSVLVEGQGNPLQTMAAYIDLNPVRAGIVDDPKDYRFCGYAEAIVGEPLAKKGLIHIWANHGVKRIDSALKAHRMLIFGKRASESGLTAAKRNQALKVLEKEDGCLPKATILRCRVRYFTDGAIFGSKEFVHGFVGAWQMEKGRKHPPRVNALRGADWGDLSVINGLKRQVFG